MKSALLCTTHIDALLMSQDHVEVRADFVLTELSKLVLFRTFRTQRPSWMALSVLWTKPAGTSHLSVLSEGNSPQRPDCFLNLAVLLVFGMLQAEADSPTGTKPRS